MCRIAEDILPSLSTSGFVQQELKLQFKKPMRTSTPNNQWFLELLPIKKVKELVQIKQAQYGLSSLDVLTHDSVHPILASY